MSAFIRDAVPGPRPSAHTAAWRSRSASAALAGAALILVSGHDPLSAYAEIVGGSLSPDSLPDTLNWATPLVGMTLAVAVPLRGGMVNLGGDGQLVIGGLIGALVPLVPAGSRRARRRCGDLCAAGSAAASTPRSRLGARSRHGVPMLISSLLLSYPAVGVTSYLARFPLRDVSTGLPQTLMVPPERAPLRPLRAAQRR